MKLYCAQRPDKNRQRLEVSALAIAETLAASVLALKVASWVGTVQFFAGSALLAPLFLLRTRTTLAAASLLALRVDVIVNRVSRQPNGPYESGWDAAKGILRIFTAIGIAGAATLPCRFAATVIGLMRAPVSSLRAIPENWVRIVASVDMTLPAEPLPGSRHEESPFTAGVATRETLTAVREELPRLKRGIDYFRFFLLTGTFGLLCLLVTVPAVVFRWTLKSTWWIYLPLLWVVHTSRSGTFLDKLTDYREQLLGKVAVLTGAGAILLVAVRWLAYEPWAKVGQWICENAPLLGEFLQPGNSIEEIPRWQVASAVNGALAVLLFLFADRALHVAKHGRPMNERFWDPVLRTLWPIRTTLTLYSILINIYTAIALVDHFGLPHVGSSWIPG